MSKAVPIVLLTDFGTKDAYVASMKGVMVNIFPEAKVLDLTHDIAAQNIKQAAFVLESAYPYFPIGSIFVSVVDPGVGSQRNILAARTQRGIFLAPDNGLLTRVLSKEKRYELRAVRNKEFFLKKISSTFHGRDCFAPASAHLAKNPALFSRVGPRIASFHRLEMPMAGRQGKKVVGEVIYFDHFGNAFTNISRDAFKDNGRGSARYVRVKGKNLGAIQKSYFEVAKKRAVAVFSSNDILELAVNQGSAQRQLKLREGTKVEVI